MARSQANSRRALRFAETLIIIVYLATHFTFEAKAQTTMSKTGVVRFLSQYGYIQPMESGTEDTMPDDEMSGAIAEFQSFLGMDVTGVMDAETTDMMTRPRCGEKDIVDSETGTRKKRWASFGNPWSKKSLTYAITKYGRKLGKTDVNSEFDKGINLWAAHTDLSFSRKLGGRVDMDIRFERGAHGDGDAFDGRGMVLAHASSPGFGTSIHFDDDERWSTRSDRGQNFREVAAHEMGHSLGLGHSRVKGALMFPYAENKQEVRLHSDDIEGIQTLYGPKTRETPRGGPNEIPNDDGDEEPGEEASQFCDDPQVDAAFMTSGGEIYFFKGDDYWMLTTDGIAAGYPRPIAKMWKGLPGNIDYAVTKESGQTFFYKGSKYWSYVGRQKIRGYPRAVRNYSADTIEASKRASSLVAMVYCIFSNKST